MKELLSYIAEHLVDDPEAVSVEAIVNGDTMTLQLRVAQADMGKVIGRQGRIAKEIRTLIKAAGLRENMRTSVDILD
ncbi:KH domain-containing protein [Acidaminobacterium chupaoyuni]